MKVVDSIKEKTDSLKNEVFGDDGLIHRVQQAEEGSVKAKFLTFFNGLTSSSKIVFVMVSFTILWMASGVFKSESHLTTSSKPMANVRVVVINKEQTSVNLKFNAKTRPQNEVILRPEVDGVVVKIFKNDGDVVKTGDPIVKLDEENTRMSYERAKTEVQKAKINYESTRAIFNQHLSSNSSLAAAKASYEGAKASLIQAEKNLEKTTITAPFDGLIDVIAVRKGDFVSNMRSSTITKVIEGKTMLAVSYLAFKDLPRIKINSNAIIRLQTGKELNGTVSFISGTNNPSTLTYEMHVKFENPDFLVRSGEVVTVQIPFATDEMLHRIPKSALSLNSQGQLVVKVIDEENKVHSKVVEILQEDSDSILITGLNEVEKIITVGHNYVNDEETVATEL
jgi:multidrug efflux system membrane fusion protein